MNLLFINDFNVFFFDNLGLSFGFGGRLRTHIETHTQITQYRTTMWMEDDYVIREKKERKRERDNVRK